MFSTAEEVSRSAAIERLERNNLMERLELFSILNFQSKGTHSMLMNLRILLLLFALWSGVANGQDKAAVDRLYNAAKKEGTVVIWGPTDAIIYQRMQEALDKTSPGIKIEHFESIPEPLVQRIIAESQAGKPAAVDVIQSGSLRALRPLIDRDMLAPYPR